MRLTTILLIILVIVVTALSCFAQNFKIRASIDRYTDFKRIIWYNDSIPGPDKREWIIDVRNEFDSTSMQFKLNYDHIEIYGDTVKALSCIVRWFNENQDRLQKKQDELYEAENVLRWIRTDGFVTNWKEFRKATDRYIKIRDYKAVMRKP